jgi:hypothetical protein
MDVKDRNARLKMDKSPYMRRSEKDTVEAFKSVERGVKPVAKDTNKTRRPETRARRVGHTVPNVSPVSSLKKALSRASKYKE